MSSRPRPRRQRSPSAANLANAPATAELATEAKIAEQQASTTLFKGETLRGLLLTAVRLQRVRREGQRCSDRLLHRGRAPAPAVDRRIHPRLPDTEGPGVRGTQGPRRHWRAAPHLRVLGTLNGVMCPSTCRESRGRVRLRPCASGCSSRRSVRSRRRSTSPCARWAAEDAGFDSLWAGEHVVFLDEYSSSYPYADDGRLSLPPESGMLDLFTTLTYLAAAHRADPSRHRGAPRAAAQPGVHGEGGLDPRLAVGRSCRLRHRHRVAPGGVRRAARTLRRAVCPARVRYLAVMWSLWTDEVSRHDGEYYSLPPCRMQPKPVQRPHPPIYFGGESDAALRRVAELGDGWHGFNHSARERRRVGAAARAGPVGRGCTRDEVDVTIGVYLQPVEPVRPARRTATPASTSSCSPCSWVDLDGYPRRGRARLGDAYVGAAAAL